MVKKSSEESKKCDVLKSVFSWEQAFMSTQQLQSPTKIVLCAVRMHMSSLGDGCFPSVERIAFFTSLSERAVRKHLNIAVEKGWLSKTVHGYNDQRWKRYEYHAEVPDSYFEEAEAFNVEGGLQTVIREKFKRKKPSTKGTDEKGTASRSAPFNEKGTARRSAPLPKGTARRSAKVRHDVPLNIQEEHTNLESNDSNTTPSGVEASEAARLKTKTDFEKAFPAFSNLPTKSNGRYDYPAEYLTFCEAYPRKVSKASAYKSSMKGPGWRASVVKNHKLLLSLFDEYGEAEGFERPTDVLIYAVKQYAAEVKEKGTKERFIKGAESFLDGHWMEYTPDQVSKSGGVASENDMFSGWNPVSADELEKQLERMNQEGQVRG